MYTRLKDSNPPNVVVEGSSRWEVEQHLTIHASDCNFGKMRSPDS